jgi:hypothetical protein
MLEKVRQKPPLRGYGQGLQGPPAPPNRPNREPERLTQRIEVLEERWLKGLVIKSAISSILRECGQDTCVISWKNFIKTNSSIMSASGRV